MATGNENLKAMRQAADFVRKHHDVLRQALISEALALDEQAEVLRELAEQGGTGLMTEEAAAETAERKTKEARRMRSVQVTLEEIVGLF